MGNTGKGKMLWGRRYLKSGNEKRGELIIDGTKTEGGLKGRRD